MKIVRKGFFDKDGIFFTCAYCNGEFLIEGREDFQTRVDIDLSEQTKVLYYSVNCPMCGEPQYLGYLDDANSIGPYNHLKYREDWNERFRVEVNA